MKRLMSSILVAVPLLAGCGSSVPPDKVYRPEAFQGKVDASLSPELQAKQNALRRFLAGIQEGIGDQQSLREFVPGINVRENFEQLVDSPARLVRWEFNGQPKGSEVPVVLYLVDDPNAKASASNERRVERTYLVSGGGRQVTIARK
jgi:hypothetical protein